MKFAVNDGLETTGVEVKETFFFVHVERLVDRRPTTVTDRERLSQNMAG